MASPLQGSSQRRHFYSSRIITSTGREDSESGHKQEQAQGGSGYRQEKAQGGSGYRQEKAQGGSGYRQDKAQAGSGYRQEKAQDGSGYRQDKAQAGSGYRQEKAQDGSGYRQEKAQGGSGYRQEKAQGGSGYRQDKAQDGSGYRQDKAQAGSGYRQEKAQDGSGYRQEKAQGGSGYRQEKAQGGSGYRQDKAQAGSGYRQEKAQGGSDYRQEKAQDGSGHRHEYAQDGSDYRQEYAQSGGSYGWRKQDGRWYRQEKVVGESGHSQEKGQSGSGYRQEKAQSGSGHIREYAPGGSDHRPEYAQSGGSYRWRKEQGGSGYRPEKAVDGSGHSQEKTLYGSDFRQDKAQSGSIKQEKAQSGSSFRREKSQSRSDLRQEKAQSGSDFRQEKAQTGSDFRQDKAQSGSVRHDKAQSGSDFRQEKAQSGSVRQDKAHSGSDFRQEKAQSGSVRHDKAQSGSGFRQEKAQSGSVRQDKAHSGSDFRQEKAQTGSDFRQEKAQSGSVRHDKAQSGSGFRQEKAQSGSVRQDKAHSGSDFRQEKAQTGSDFRQEKAQSGSVRHNKAQSGSGFRQEKAQSGSEFRQKKAQSGSGFRQEKAVDRSGYKLEKAYGGSGYRQEKAHSGSGPRQEKAMDGNGQRKELGDGDQKNDKTPDDGDQKNEKVLISDSKHQRGRRSGQENTRRPGKAVVFPDTKPSHPEPVKVYVKIHAVIQDIKVLGKVLTSKVNSPDVELIPVETDVQRDDSFTYCFMKCSSKKLAKKLRNMLLRNKNTFTPSIDVSFDSFAPIKTQSEQRERARKETEEQVNKEFRMRSEEALHAHEQKIRDSQDRIEKTKGRLNDRKTIKNTQKEIMALEQKLDELNKQKAEFLAAAATFQQNLTCALKEDNYKSKIPALCKQLGIECCRLEKALPMYACRRDVVQMVRENPVCVLLAETGSGKSTQVVQYLLEAGLAQQGKIVCTQPRKVATVSLATHVAQELAGNVGREVGYQAGSRAKVSPSTKVVYMTDHALLNQCLTDPDLSAFTCVVVDEAHERSLYTDLLLAMVKRCQRRRDDLRVIITSATIDPQMFVDFFGSCPVMKVSGRAFPVDVVWQDVVGEEQEFENYLESCISKVVEIHRQEPPGDILVFVTSALETQKCCDIFEEKMRNETNFKCFQLHGQLQADEQQKVFDTLERNKRKIVFATNCAETSITIDGIRYVVDSGVAKELRYDAKRNLRSLNVTVISQSSAEQRKGRAGRTAPGKCYRLYSQCSFQAMDKISLPEILKTHLGHALLKLAELGVRRDMYDFVQSPGEDAIDAALVTLHQLGALDGGAITETGRWISRLPFDPRYGLMTKLGCEQGLLYDSIVLAALASTGSGLFYKGASKEDLEKLSKSKMKFSHPGGDILTSLEVFREWQGVAEREKNRWCMANSINARLMRMVRDTVNDVCRQLKQEERVDVRHAFSEDPQAPDALRRIQFLCSTSNLCHFLGREKAGYFAALASKQVHFFPSSSVCSLASFPEWVVFDQLLQTSRDFITGITPVDEAWLTAITKEKNGFDVEEVRQKKLQNVFTQPAGVHVFSTMVGPRYTKLRELQDSIPASDSSVVVLEANRELGKVQLFCTEVNSTVMDLEQVLRGLADFAVEELRQEVLEVSVGSEESGLRVVLSEGASVSEILMPHETRKVFITKASEDATVESIKQKFEQYGSIVFYKQFLEGPKWGMLIFQTAAEAKAAAEGTKDDDEDVAELERRRCVKANTEFKARVFWTRRRAKGFGFVDVSETYLTKCLSICLYIDGGMVKIKPDKKNEGSLYLTGLPPDITEDLLKRHLLNELGLGEDAVGIVKKVSIPRDKGFKTTHKELPEMEEAIAFAFERFLVSSKVKVNVFMPKTELTARYQAEAYFTDPIEGLAACRKVRKDFSGFPGVEVEPCILTTLQVASDVYEACRVRVDEATDELRNQGVKVEVKRQKGGSLLFQLKADDSESLVRARTVLSGELKGDVLECNHAPALRHLLTAAGRGMLRDTERQTAACIKVDCRLSTISIHGSEEMCTQVKMMINTYLDEVLGSSRVEVCLRGEGRPPGLLKALLKQHGDDLQGLVQQAGLHSITVDYRRHQLKLIGPEASVEKGKEVVEDKASALTAANPQDASLEDESLDCSACFCPIEKNDLYRLEACGHPFCKDCIKHQVVLAVKDSSQLPIVCCYDGCDLPLVLRDFRNLSRLGHFQVAKLAASALASYVLTNRDKARFCSTPNCPMVYRVTSQEDASVFQCPACSVQVCTACHKQAHAGMTCAMLGSSKMAEKGLESWMKEAKNRTLCPGCSAPIEKIAGCNKMRCDACGVIFCWKCSKKFPTSSACYDHLVEKHGAVFDLADVLNE